MIKPQQIKIFSVNKLSLFSIKKQMDYLTANQVTRLGMRVGLTTLGLSLLVISFSLTKLPPEIPLFFSQPYGVERLASSWWLGILPLINLLVQVISMRFAGSIIEEDELLAQILVVSGALVGLMSFYTMIKIVWLVT
jgi:hypothetical protein